MIVVWSKRARRELQKAHDYISLDSEKNAEIVQNALVDLTINLSTDPTKYPIDKFKTHNDGTWRAFEKYHYRISYRILKDRILVARLRHVKRSPTTY